MFQENSGRRLRSERLGLALRSTCPFLLLLLSIVVISVAPSYSTSMLPWTDLPVGSWLRLIAAIYVTSFAPGYFLLLVFRVRRYCGYPGLFVLSYLVSLFLTGLLGFFLLISNLPIQEFGPMSILLLNCALVIPAVVKTYRGEHGGVEPLEARASTHLPDGAVIAVAVLITIGAVIINTSNSLFLIGAQNYFLNQGIALLKDFPVGLQGSFAGHYDYWFAIYIANFLVLTGLPSVNGYLTLLLFAGMPTLAFYTMIERLTKNKGLALIATVMMSFQGFGWIYVAYQGVTQPQDSLFNLLYVAGARTYDLFNASAWLPNIVHPIFLVAFPTFCILICLAFDHSLPRRARYFSISTLVALGYLSHHYEVFFFVIFYSLITACGQILGKYKHDPNMTFSIVIGLVFVALVDLLSPGKQYVVEPNTLPLGPALSLSYVYGLALALSISPLAVHVARKYISFRTGFRGASMGGKMKSSLAMLLLWVYFAFLWVWIEVQQTIEFGEYLYVPIFAYPMRFGVNLIIAILSLIMISSGTRLVRGDVERKALILMGTMGLVAFALGRASDLLGLGYEARLSTFFAMFLATISAFAIRYLISIKQMNRPLLRKLSIGFVSLVILSGAMSTSTHFVFWSVVTASQEPVARLSQDEIYALDYLRTAINPQDYVLTISSLSKTYLTTLAGATSELYSPEDAWKGTVEAFWTADTVEALGYLIGKTNPRFIYLAQRDAVMLESYSRGLLYSLLDFFPTVYSNDEVRIIQFPDLSVLPGSTNAVHWFEQSFLAPDWVTSNIENVSHVGVNSSLGYVAIEGTFNASRGLIVLARSSLSLPTSDYNFFTVKWTGSGNVSSVLVYYSDGNTTTVVESESARSWRETTVVLPPNKIVSKLELRADNFWSIERGDNSEGNCSAAYAYVGFSSLDYLLYNMRSSSSDFQKMTQALSHTIGNITLQGNIAVSSAGLKQITGRLLLVNGSASNTTTMLIGNGQVNATIHFGQATVVPTGLSNLTLIYASYLSDGIISLGTNGELTIFSNGSSVRTTRNGSYLLEPSDGSSEILEILMEKPDLVVGGNVSFKSAYFWPFEPRSWGADLIVKGSSSFSVVSSDNSILIVEIDHIDGKIEASYPYAYTGQRDELSDIVSSLASPSGVLILLIGSCITLLVTVFIRKMLRYIDLPSLKDLLMGRS